MLFARKLLTVLAVVGCLWAHAGASTTPVRAPRAMVTSAHEQATAAGLEMLRAGGNAVDAAVATGFALAVVYPAAGNLGGGGFLLLRRATGEVHFLDYREQAPAAAHRDMYLDASGKLIPEASLLGYRAAAVPGSVAGMVHAQRKWGRLTLRRVMAPAIRLAERGFPLNARDARSLRNEDLARSPEARRIFQRDGRFYGEGEVFRQPLLARTLKRIAADPESFYRGALARQLAAGVGKEGGLITAQDLAAYEVKERAPVRGSYRGYEVISAPPPSSGGVALLQMLNILEGYDLAALGRGSAASMHLMAEAMRRAFYDRATLMGDPDFVAVPVAQLVEKAYAEAWRASIEEARASVSDGLLRPAGFLPEGRKAAGLRPESPETTHYSIVDAEGNAVAVTTTLNDSFGAKVMAPGLGFLLNNEMDDFAAKPGEPNLFDLIQGEANAIAPGKRPLSSMTPTMVLRDGKLRLVLGSPGGPRIITAVLSVLLDVVDHGMNIQEAVNAPRFHHQWLPDRVALEPAGFSPDTLRLLEERGHRFAERKVYWGHCQCIAIDPRTGERLGASDPRTQGKAAGF
jgi:gamma-glutamyltranspeptidase/glutathione hydrolase